MINALLKLISENHVDDSWMGDSCVTCAPVKTSIAHFSNC